MHKNLILETLYSETFSLSSNMHGVRKKIVIKPTKVNLLFRKCSKNLLKKKRIAKILNFLERLVGSSTLSTSVIIVKNKNKKKPRCKIVFNFSLDQIDFFKYFTRKRGILLKMYKFYSLYGLYVVNISLNKTSSCLLRLYWLHKRLPNFIEPLIINYIYVKPRVVFSYWRKKWNI